MGAAEKISQHPLLSQLHHKIGIRMGLSCSNKSWQVLQHVVSEIAETHGFKNLESCIRWLLSAPFTQAQLDLLVNHLTVGETYFFRNPKDFEFLEAHILPELVMEHQVKGRFLKIWSAGCSTGEEAYSIAISIYNRFPSLRHSAFLILATDINSEALKKASAGIFRDWSFRNCSTWLKDRYFFKRNDGSFEVLPEIKESMRFSYLNLAEASYPSLLNNTNAMDIIFCRNVLMYFLPEKAKDVIHRFSQSLNYGGCIILGPTDSFHLENSDFTQFRLSRVEGKTINAFRKVEQESPRNPLPLDRVIAREEKLMNSNLISSVLPPGVQGRQSTSFLRKPEPQKLKLARSDKAALMSRACANAGNLAEALKWSEKAIAADRLNASLYYLAATIFQELGQYEKAILMLKHTLYLDPDFILAHFFLGNLYFRQGKVRQGRKHFENAQLIMNQLSEQDLLPESDGLTVKRLRDMIQATERLK